MVLDEKLAIDEAYKDIDELQESHKNNIEIVANCGRILAGLQDLKSKLSKENNVTEIEEYKYQNSSSLCGYRKTCIQHPLVCIICTRKNKMKDCYKKK